MNQMPEKIKQQIDDLFNEIEYIGDEYTIFFHKNGEPIFAVYENVMGSNDVAFFRDIGNPIFYFMEGSETVHEYIYQKVKEKLINMGMPEEMAFYLYTFNPERDRHYREVFYEVLEDGGLY